MKNKSFHKSQSGNNLKNDEVQALTDYAELAGDWFWEQDAEFRFTSFSGVSTEKLRRNQKEFIGKRRWEMPIHGVTPEQLADHIAIHERHEAFRRFEYNVLGAGGAVQYYSVSGKPIFNEHGEFVGYRGIGRNVTDLRLAELAIKESELKMQQIVHGNPVPAFVIDINHQVTHWNQACAILTGFSERDLMDGTPLWRAFFTSPRPTMADLIISGANDEVISSHYENVKRSDLIDEAYEAEMLFDRSGRDPRWLYVTSAPLKDTTGQFIGAIETLQDITTEKSAKTLLENLASHDGLTGVANRRTFDTTLAAEWKRAQRESRSLSLLMLDIDNFKLFNDSYGHQAGDHCLQRIAQAINNTVMRPGDLVARYGGEEFAVILSSATSEGSSTVAKRILECIKELAIIHINGINGYVSLSIGICSVVPTPEIKPETLIKSADSALYEAKRSGRNRFVVAEL